MAADALTIPPSVEAMTAKLRHLLDRAREIKSVQTIEPPLPVTDLIQETTILRDGIFDGESDAHQYTVVETAARKIFYETLVSSQANDLASSVAYFFSSIQQQSPSRPSFVSGISWIFYFCVVSWANAIQYWHSI